MAWIIFIVALALAIALAIVTYGHRKALSGLFIVVAIALGVLIWYGESRNRGDDNRLSISAIVLDNFEISHTYGSSYKMTARVKNNSPEHKLTRLGVSVIARDCVTRGDGERSCVVVGDKPREIFIVVPPGQARDVAEQLQFENMRPTGELSWDYRIDYTRAE